MNFNYITKTILRFILRRKIANIKGHIESCPDNADISRDGKSAIYWEGKLDGLAVALVLLGLIDIRDKDVDFARRQCEGMSKGFNGGKES